MLTLHLKGAECAGQKQGLLLHIGDTSSACAMRNSISACAAGQSISQPICAWSLRNAIGCSVRHLLTMLLVRSSMLCCSG